MSGTVANPEGITNPPIDDLLEKVESKYALVVYAAKRARQINTYNLEIAEGMFSTPGPLIDYDPEDKALGIALREIDQGVLNLKEHDDSSQD
ncbi:MAG: DNA-directed RNA polymerase subunit omega [Varibaculum cambriense]|nr:DNA-directed RNA polymerase subunit omega [Varibaculum cambriense]